MLSDLVLVRMDVHNHVLLADLTWSRIFLCGNRVTSRRTQGSTARELFTTFAQYFLCPSYGNDGWLHDCPDIVEKLTS